VFFTQAPPPSPSSQHRVPAPQLSHSRREQALLVKPHFFAPQLGGGSHTHWPPENDSSVPQEPHDMLEQALETVPHCAPLQFSGLQMHWPEPLHVASVGQPPPSGPHATSGQPLPANAVPQTSGPHASALVRQRH
jgi:hypothetical protein